jgi:hypothetical protein
METEVVVKTEEVIVKPEWVDIDLDAESVVSSPRWSPMTD